MIGRALVGALIGFGLIGGEAGKKVEPHESYLISRYSDRVESDMLRSNDAINKPCLVETLSVGWKTIGDASHGQDLKARHSSIVPEISFHFVALSKREVSVFVNGARKLIARKQRQSQRSRINAKLLAPFSEDFPFESSLWKKPKPYLRVDTQSWRLPYVFHRNTHRNHNSVFVYCKNVVEDRDTNFDPGPIAGDQGPFRNLSRLSGGLGIEAGNAQRLLHIASLVGSDSLGQSPLHFASFPQPAGGLIQTGRLPRQDGRKPYEQEVAELHVEQPISQRIKRAALGYGFLALIGIAFLFRRSRFARWTDYLPVVAPVLLLLLWGFV